MTVKKRKAVSKRSAIKDFKPAPDVPAAGVSAPRKRKPAPKSRQKNAPAEMKPEFELALAALEDLSAAVLIKDADLRYCFVNDAFAKILGKSAKQLLGRTTLEIFGEERSNKYDGLERKVIKSGRQVEYDEEFEGATGNIISAKTSIRRLKNSDGQYFACVVLLDVTEQKERENRLERLAAQIEQHRQKMESFAATNSDWFWEMNADLQFSYFSDSFETVTGVPPSKLLGKTRRQTGVPGITDEEFRQHLKILDEHKAFRDFTHSRTKPDGQTIWLSISGSPSFDEDGNFQGYQGSGRDVTAQVMREHALDKARREAQEAESKSQLLTELLAHAPTAVYAKDKELRIIYGNRAWEKIAGMALADAVGKTDVEIFGEAGKPFMQADREVLERGKSAETRESEVLENGETQHRTAYRARFTDDQGEHFLVGVTVDVTDQMEKQRQLEVAQAAALNADRAKSEFLANMSHEIRTPMNGVMGMAELLTKTDLDARQKMFTDVIVKSGASLLTIINDILDFSKLDAGQLELDPAPFRLAEAIEDVATLVSSRVAEKDLEMIVRVDPQLPEYLVGDVGRIRQIITNLMGNAVKFTEKGHVYVNVQPRDLGATSGRQSLRFEVKDTGIGIPEDKCAAVFEKFNQVDTSSSRRHEGTGLGLTIASSLVKIMGGDIGVTSKVGEGSTFWFEIELDTHYQSSQRKRVPMDVSGSRILIVDDNAVNRSILSEQMTAWHFDSAAAIDGNEALTILRAACEQGVTVDCVVLDYHMPGMNGGEVVKKMRQEPAMQNIPVIMLTSVDQTEEGKAFSSLKIQGHLTKPARSSHLLETIIDVLHETRNNTLESAPQIAVDVATPAKPEISIPERDTAADELESVVEITEPSLEKGNRDSVDILVCEDNEVNQIVFSQILQAAGYQFEIAANGRIGIESMKRLNPSLILMDVSMPEMNGLEATTQIRRMEEKTGRNIPIIGVTAHAIKGDMEKCLDAGMSDYLSKPVSPDRLEEKIRYWMAKSDNVKTA